MKILLLAADAYGGRGGIALYTRDTVQALAEMPEVERVVVIPRSVPMEPRGIPQKVHFVTGAAGSKARYLLFALRAAVNQYDLVICGHINLLPLAHILNRLICAPLVLMVYGIDVWDQPKRITQWQLRQLSSIWSISAVTMERMNAWVNLPESKYAVLPNAIHLEKYGVGEKRRDLLAKYGLCDAKVIMTLARLSAAERYKGLDEVLNVMPGLLKLEPRLKYVIAGDGDDRPRLEARVRSLGLEDKVVFAGMVEEKDKADVLRLADAFVMPGSGEGFGFVFLEALACGIPVVGSRIDGSREALRFGMLGTLVDPRDPRCIQQGILEALGKRPEIPAGIEHFSWPAFSTRVSASVMKLMK